MAMSLKERIEAIVLGCFGSVLSVAVLSAGAVVMAWLAGQSAYVSGIPAYKAISIGAGVFLILAFALYLLIIAVGRYRNLKVALSKDNDLTKREDHIKDLEQEITSLKHDGAVADGTIQRLKVELRRSQESAETHSLRANIRDGELETLKTKYEWLDEIVEYQRNGLRKYVLVEKCEINTSPLSQGKRYFEFVFHVRNYSMFYVSIPMGEYDPVKGAIKFKGDPLSGEAKVVDNRITKLQPYGRNYFKVWQWVNQDEAKDIPHILTTVGNLFDFSAAVVYIKAERFPDDEAAKLELTRGMEGTDIENKIIQLENCVAAWQRHSGTIEELRHALGGAYVLYNLFEAGDSPSRERIERWFDSSLRGHIHPDLLETIKEGMPELTDSSDEQRVYVDRYCFKLRAVIEEERGKLSIACDIENLS